MNRYARGDHWGDHHGRGINRRTDGCNCPAVRYHPRQEPPVSTDCPHHGTETKEWT